MHNQEKGKTSNNLILNLKELEKEQAKPKASRRNNRGEINSRKTIGKINKKGVHSLKR